MTRLLLLVPLAIAALVAGCGSSNSSSTASGSSSPGSTSSSAPATGSTSSSSGAGAGALTLDETEFKITPASSSVSKTGAITILVKNTGKVIHALAIQTPSGIVKSPTLQPGQSATLKVEITKGGSYTFYCPIDGHRGLGMVGTLIVGGGSSGGAGSGTTSTSSSGGAGY